MKLNKYSLVILSLTGGLLSGLAWSEVCTGLVLLISFVPFFIIGDHLCENSKRYTPNAYFLILLPGLLLFSIIVMGWMRVASMAGAIMVITGLTVLMALTLWLAYIIRVRTGKIAGTLAVFSLWMSYELISLNTFFISPWMNLGNGLAKDIFFIQWYEYTGTGGGTLWILLSNSLAAHIIIRYTKGLKVRNQLVAWILLIIIPSGFSAYRYLSVNENTEPSQEVLIIQPNTDPYTEKFVIPFKTQLQKVIKMASDQASPETDWIITPETTVDDPVNLTDLNNDKYILMLKGLTEGIPDATIVSGLVTYRQYTSKDAPPTKSAVKRDTSGYYSDHYNSAIRIDTGRTFEFYHKSKLVPGIERQLLGTSGKLVSRLLPYLGGTGWGYGWQNERTVLSHHIKNTKIAPVICYESVFGSFVTGFTRKGAGAIFIMTNDGWWKNTGGYRQHLNYASIRAIENRRPVARCGNTGISCFIDIRGKIRQETGWYQEAVVKGRIIPENRITFYSLYGDYLYRISLFISILIVLYTFVALPARKKQKKSGTTMQPGGKVCVF